jgi:hypothetical protein
VSTTWSVGFVFCLDRLRKLSYCPKCQERRKAETHISIKIFCERYLLNLITPTTMHASYLVKVANFVNLASQYKLLRAPSTVFVDRKRDVQGIRIQSYGFKAQRLISQIQWKRISNPKLTSILAENSHVGRTPYTQITLPLPPLKGTKPLRGVVVLWLVSRRVWGRERNTCLYYRLLVIDY